MELTHRAHTSLTRAGQLDAWWELINDQCSAPKAVNINWKFPGCTDGEFNSSVPGYNEYLADAQMVEPGSTFIMAVNDTCWQPQEAERACPFATDMNVSFTSWFHPSHWLHRLLAFVILVCQRTPLLELAHLMLAIFELLSPDMFELLSPDMFSIRRNTSCW